MSQGAVLRTQRGQPITRFRISSLSSLMQVEEWNAREAHAVCYGLPLEAEYTHPSGQTVVRCMAQATRGDGEVLGYLAMPRRYVAAWSQLSYNVVYWTSMWKAWLAERSKPNRRRTAKRRRLISLCIERTSCLLMKYLHIRRLIIDELVENRETVDEDVHLDVFDEYIIRDRFDWLWTQYRDVPQPQLLWLSLDPVHESNQDIFFTPLSTVSPQMVVPRAAPPQTWARGVINHFDFQKYFDQSIAALVRWVSSPKNRSAIYNPYDRQTAVQVVHWHEDHDPPVRFMDEEEANLPPAHRSIALTDDIAEEDAEETSDSSARRGVIDNQKTRDIVLAFTRTEGGIGLGKAHDLLSALLGAHYDAGAWGLLLDGVQSEPDEEPALSVDEAFEKYGVNSGGIREEGMDAFRNTKKTLL